MYSEYVSQWFNINVTTATRTILFSYRSAAKGASPVYATYAMGLINKPKDNLKGTVHAKMENSANIY